MKTFAYRTCILFLTIFLLQFTSSAQVSLRQLAEGKNGVTVAFTSLPVSQQIVFNPSNAKKVLELHENSNMILMRTDLDQLGYNHHRFYQTFQDIPVENSMYIMHEKDGYLTGMSGVAVLEFDEQLQAVPSLTKEKAIRKALQRVDAQKYAWQSADMEQGLKEITGDVNASYYPSVSLVWYSPGDIIEPRNLHLAYKVDVYATKPLSRAFYFVDAQTGEILGDKDELFYSDATGTANTAYSGTQTIHSDLSGSSYRLRDYTKGNGVITLRATTGHGDYTNASANWSLSASDQYALDAHYGVSQTYAFYKANFNRNSINDNGFALTSYVNETSTVNNAYWDGSIMHFGVRSSGAGITAIDVTGHELTHGLTQYTSKLNYSNESGAMNESMSDIFGKSVQFWSKPNDVNWLLSNDMNWAIRNMANPKQYGQPNTYKGTNWYIGTSDNGGVHTNSGIGNYMFYLLVNGGSGTNDIGSAYTVTGLGLTEADAILYRSETVYLTSTSQYVNWRDACIYAASDLYGASSNEVAQVKNAWYAVGIGTDATGAGPCSSPSGLSVSVSSTSAILTWSNTGAVSYNLQWKLSSASTWNTITGLAINRDTLLGLSTCTTYQFQVQGVCNSSSSAYSTTTSFTTTGCPVSYCNSKGNSTSYEYIKNVTLGTINNTTGSNSGYGNYTALSTNLTGGASTTITLTPGFASSSYNEFWTIYIDYNHNGSFFDAGEKVAQTTGSKVAISASFSVPATALNGTTRMRIQMQYGSNSTSPCATFSYGEVEDYTVNITGNAQFDSGNNGFDASTLDNLSEVKLYPNPAQDNLTIEFVSNNENPVRMNIYNISAQKVITKQTEATEGLNTQNINTNSLGNGVYILEIQNNGAVQRQKFIIAP